MPKVPVDPIRSGRALAREDKRREKALTGGWHCLRCGWNWLSRSNAVRFAEALVYLGVQYQAGDVVPPGKCPHCKSLAWNRRYRGKRTITDYRWNSTNMTPERAVRPHAEQIVNTSLVPE